MIEKTGNVIEKGLLPRERDGSTIDRLWPISAGEEKLI